MTVVASRKLADIAEKIGAGRDPRQTILASIGEKRIHQFEPFHNLVLVATYVRGERSKGGIILGGDRTRAEDRFQGKIGLVLKVGPTAFKGKTPDSFGGITVKPGEWVMYRTSDANEFFFVDEKTGLDGDSARLIEDTLIMARVADPEAIY